MKTKHVLSGVFSVLAVIGASLLTNNYLMAANTNTNTTLGIKTGFLMFYKDTGASMDSYFGHAANQATSIDIGTYDASLSTISASSSGDHRFTVSDMAGKSFTVTVQSSALTAEDGTIPASAVGYTGTTWYGTGKALTSAPTGAVDIGTAPVTFVARTNNSGVSKFSQEITLKVTIPAAQAPGSYTGVLTFTY